MVNMDTDDHTVVSNDFFNTSSQKGIDVLLWDQQQQRETRHIQAPLLTTLRFTITVASTRIWTTTISQSRQGQTAESRTLTETLGRL